jgi:hypothetical protein
MSPEAEAYFRGKRMRHLAFVDGRDKRGRWGGSHSECGDDKRLTRVTRTYSRGGATETTWSVNGRPVADLDEAYRLLVNL